MKNMNTPKFSVALIARNEARTLPRLLKSLEDFKARGGEIIVVDTGSTDDTAEIAHRFGCFVFEEGSHFIQVIDKETAVNINERFVKNGDAPIVKDGDRLFDFSAARNYAASKAGNDWVVMADCDEIFTAFNVEALTAQVTWPGNSRLEFDFVFSHNEAGEPTMQFRQQRFYDRTKYQWNPKSIVHEVLTPLGTDAPARYVPPSVLKLEHFQNTATNRSSYLVGLAMDCFLNPDNDRNSHYFGRELFYTRRYHSAITEFRRHIAMNKWAAERGQSAVYIGDCCAGLKQAEEALYWWNKAFLIDGSRREPLLRLAWHFYRQGDHHKTAAYAAAALALPKNGFYMDNENHYRQEPHELLYWALWYLGDKSGSKHHWQNALEYQPENKKYLSDAQFYR
jgi:glycosyltransferase involved in cell wall biosynthesis